MAKSDTGNDDSDGQLPPALLAVTTGTSDTTRNEGGGAGQAATVD